MTPQHKRILVKNRLDITQNMMPQVLLRYLRSKNAFTAYDVELVETGLTGLEQNQLLLDTLSKKADIAFHHFVEGLRSTSQPHIAGLLQKNGMNFNN